MNLVWKRRLLVLVGAAAAACQSASANPKAAAELLRVGGRSLSVADAQKSLDALPPEKRGLYRTPEERAAFLRSMVDHEVLAVEAESLGYARAPEVVAAMKHAMVLKLLKERIGERPEPGELDEAAARAYYTAHPAEFGPPERAVVALIRMHDPARADAVRAEAARAVDDALAHGGSSAAFQAFQGLVAKYADEPGARDVTLVLDRNVSAYPDAVIAAARSMKDVGGVSPLVTTQDGQFVVQLKERLAASVLPFERVRDHALRSASEELRDKKTTALAAELARARHAEVHPELFAAVKF